MTQNTQNLSINQLSFIETQVLRQIALGKQSKEIAAILCLSVHTIKNHKTNICVKLQLKGTHELLIFSLKNATLLQKGGGANRKVSYFFSFSRI